MAAAATTAINSTAACTTPSFSSSQRLKLQILFCNPFNQKKKKKNETTLFYETAVSVRCDAVVGSSTEALQQLKASRFDRYTKENSSIVVIGINVHTAPVELLEKLVIPEAQWPLAIGELSALNHIEEAAVYSTCNRMEIYVVALSQHRGVKEVTEWMSKISGIPTPEICKHRFILHNKDAARHLFEVASGLDSVISGELQIFNQVKRVKKLGQGVAGFNRKISGLFEHAIIAGKRVQTETSISSASVSVSSAAAELALLKLSLSSYATIRVLVVGAGKMAKLVVKHLVSKGCKRVVVVSRTEEKVTALCREFKDTEIIHKSLSQMMECAVGADVIFTCTTSDTPLILRRHVQELLLLSPNIEKRIFLDISVPRNVEPCVSDLATVEVYNVDDIKEVVTADKEDRIQKTVEAQSIISDELLKFEAWKDSLEAVPTIKKLRAYAERIRASEIEKCLSKMGNITEQQQKAIYDLSMGILKLFLHGPMQHLRCEASDCHKPEQILDIMRTINTVYDLEKEIFLETILNKIERTQK